MIKRAKIRAVFFSARAVSPAGEEVVIRVQGNRRSGTEVSLTMPDRWDGEITPTTPPGHTWKSDRGEVSVR